MPVHSCLINSTNSTLQFHFHDHTPSTAPSTSLIPANKANKWCLRLGSLLYTHQWTRTPIIEVNCRNISGDYSSKNGWSIRALCPRVWNFFRFHPEPDNQRRLFGTHYRISQNDYVTFITLAAGSTVWNSLPDFIRDPTISADCFKRLLKTYLFAGY